MFGNAFSFTAVFDLLGVFFSPFLLYIYCPITMGFSSGSCSSTYQRKLINVKGCKLILSHGLSLKMCMLNPKIIAQRNIHS